MAHDGVFLIEMVILFAAIVVGLILVLNIVNFIFNAGYFEPTDIVIVEGVNAFR